MADYTNQAQQRILRLVEVLHGAPRPGFALNEIARAMGAASPMILRDLSNLGEAGWAEHLETGRWRLTGREWKAASGLEQSITAIRKELDFIEKQNLGGMNG